MIKREQDLGSKRGWEEGGKAGNGVLMIRGRKEDARSTG